MHKRRLKDICFNVDGLDLKFERFFFNPGSRSASRGVRCIRREIKPFTLAQNEEEAQTFFLSVATKSQIRK